MSLAPTAEVNFPQAVADSAGIPQSVADEMLIAPFNELDAVASLLDEHDDVAAIIVQNRCSVLFRLCPGFWRGYASIM